MDRIRIVEWRMHQRMLFCVVGLTVLSAAAHAQRFPEWAYPGCPGGKDASDPELRLSVPDSPVHFTKKEIADRTHTRDWFPGQHPPMPDVLRSSHSPGGTACGYCHLADGTGRPENGKVAGLDKQYIIAQVNAIHRGERKLPQADYLPLTLMAASLPDLTVEELNAAADYYSKHPTHSFVKVVETASVPQFETACFFYRKKGAGELPLGPRIIELPDDAERFEARDPHTTYTAYVPRGSIGRGRALARNGGGRAQPCTACHGEELKGGEGMVGPPIAGRFASYLFRQMHAFKTGTRSGASAEPMRLVVTNLSIGDFIDLSAYAASLPP